MKTDFAQMSKGFFCVQPTFRCNISCEHCLHSCSWERKETMSLQLFSSCVIQALEQGWKTLCLTGGEPFLVPDYIRMASKLCLERGAGLVVQTNGFWGRNPTKALRMLENMRGITQIGFSVDKVHLKEIELDTILNAIKATVEAGIYNVSLSISYQTELEFQLLKEQFTSCFPGIEVAGWHILPIGRARNHPELIVDYSAYTWDRLQRNCDAQRQLNPLIQPNGDIHPCYRPIMALEETDVLRLGNLNDHSLAELLGDIQNKLFMFIIAYGGGGLGYLLQKSPYEWLLRKEYQGVCHFCYEVLSRPVVITYLNKLLDEDALETRIAEGLKKAYNGWKDEKSNACERILICNGSSCGRNHQTYPIIHYLFNRLVELNKTHLAKIEQVDCLHSCGTGPNLYLERQGKLVQGVNLAMIDSIIEGLHND